MKYATMVMERCDIMAGISEESGALTRPFGSRAMREANEVVAGWMREAGMSVRLDAIGNLIGRYEGTGEKTMVLGSHLDTVRDAGRYDGQLGVMVALACVGRLHERNERPPFSIEVVAFADEEGLRFGTTFLGSSVYAGDFDRELLDLKDENGITLSEAVRDFRGDPYSLAADGRALEDLIGYCEVHIEQGPVLEESDSPVGVVSAISGLSRVEASFTGRAGHAGTVPMESRRDALCAAAELVLETERAARAESGSVATVGKLSAHPGAGNVIPGEANVSLDIRHQENPARERLRDLLSAKTREIADSRGCEYEWRVRQETPAVPLDPDLSALLAGAVRDRGFDVHQLPSGAGHDAAQMSALTAVAMLFVRCKEGISHNPEESVSKEDVGVAIDVMSGFISLLTRNERQDRQLQTKQTSS